MRFTLSLILSLTSLVVCGQFNKGTYSLGGSGSIRWFQDKPVNPVDKFKSTDLVLSPEYGYFLLNNFQVGIGIYYRHFISSSDSPNFYDRKLNAFGGLLLTRYYFHRFFVEAQYNIQRSRYEVETFPVNKSTEDMIHVGLGRAFMVSKQVAIEPKVFYQKVIYEPNNDLKARAINFVVGIRVYINSGDN